MTVGEAAQKLYLALASEPTVVQVAAYPAFRHVTCQDAVAYPSFSASHRAESVLVDVRMLEATDRPQLWGLPCEVIAEYDEATLAVQYRQALRRARQRIGAEA